MLPGGTINVIAMANNFIRLTRFEVAVDVVSGAGAAWMNPMSRWKLDALHRSDECKNQSSGDL